MRLKRPVKNKIETIGVRCTKDEKHAIQGKANIYTEGNLSEFMIYASLNFVAGKEDFEEEIKSAPRKVRR